MDVDMYFVIFTRAREGMRATSRELLACMACISDGRSTGDSCMLLFERSVELDRLDTASGIASLYML